MEESSVLHLRIVVLDNLTHGPQGRHVLVDTIRTHVVERVRRAGVTIRTSKVNPHLQRRSSSQIIRKAAAISPRTKLITAVLLR